MLSDDDTPKSARPAHPLDSFVALDAEFVGIGDGSINMLGRVSLVSCPMIGEGDPDILFDSFVRPTAPVTDYRTWVSGIRPADLDTAPAFADVRQRVGQLLVGKCLIGHAVHNDLAVLQLRMPPNRIRDTQSYPPLQRLLSTSRPALRNIVRCLFPWDRSFQVGEHSSVEDARMVMRIYLLHAAEWEASLNSPYRAIFEPGARLASPSAAAPVMLSTKPPTPAAQSKPATAAQRVPKPPVPGQAKPKPKVDRLVQLPPTPPSSPPRMRSPSPPSLSAPLYVTPPILPMTPPASPSPFGRSLPEDDAAICSEVEAEGEDDFILVYKKKESRRQRRLRVSREKWAVAKAKQQRHSGDFLPSLHTASFSDVFAV